MALVPESAQEKAAPLHCRWLRVLILGVILLGGFDWAPVEANDTGKQPAQVIAKKPKGVSAPSKTALTYLQLSATRRQGAELMIDSLRKKNFDAVAVEVDGKPGVFRVLVGPVMNTGVLQLRANLERAGFPGNAAIRRTLAESNSPEPDNAISLPARTTKEGATDRPFAGRIYLEVSVTSRDNAHLLVGALHQKKFNALASEIMEKPGMSRVLVGPVEETGAGIAQMRADLEGTGFPGSVAIRIPPESDPAESATKADVSIRPVAGQAYLEFSATSPQTAEIIADALLQKGFDATASETDDPPGGFRVLIRPMNDTSIDQLRADLERAGFHADAAVLRILK